MDKIWAEYSSLSAAIAHTSNSSDEVEEDGDDEDADDTVIMPQLDGPTGLKKSVSLFVKSFVLQQKRVFYFIYFRGYW